MGEFDIGKEAENLQTQESIQGKGHRAQHDEEGISTVIAISTMINRVVNEQVASREQQERHESGKRNREIATICVIAATAVIALATLVVTHFDTERALSEARDAAERQHADTVAAIELSKVANKTAADTAAAQIAEMAAQSNAMRGQLDQMKIQSTIQTSPLSPRMKFGGLDISQATMVHPGYWQFTPKWTNTGQTNAEKYRSWDEVKLFPGGIPDDFDCTKPDHVLPAPPELTVGQDETILQESLFLSPDLVRLVAEGSGAIIFFGGIEWHDAFPGTPRHYRIYALRLLPQIVGTTIDWPSPLAYRSECNRGGDEK